MTEVRVYDDAKEKKIVRLKLVPHTNGSVDVDVVDENGTALYSLVSIGEKGLCQYDSIPSGLGLKVDSDGRLKKWKGD